MNVKLLFLPLAVIVLIWSFIAYDKTGWDEYKQGEKEKAELQKEADILSAGVEHIRVALTEYKKLDDDAKARIYNAMPMNVDSDNLVAEINESANQSGGLIVKVGTNNKLTSKTSNTPCKKGEVCVSKARTLGVSMSVIGVYPVVKDFLAKLDTQNRVIIPQELNLTVPQVVNATPVESEENVVQPNNKFVTVTAKFDVLYKEKNQEKALSKIIGKDRVLDKLLESGLDKEAIETVGKVVTSQIFTPVQIEGAGKENLFE